MDKFYTPPELAKEVVKVAKLDFEPAVIADFAAGAGNLLSPAHEKWNSSLVVANDVDTAAVRRLRRLQPSWILSSVDFLNPNLVSRSNLASVRGAIDLALLNPPFTSRGSTKIEVNLGSELLECGRSLAFVAESLKYLGPRGVAIAILPTGTFAAQRDQKVLNVLNQGYEIDVLQDLGRYAFSGVSPETCITRLTKKKKPKRSSKNENLNGQPPAATELIDGMVVSRGSFPMHYSITKKVRNGRPLVHTTYLREGKIDWEMSTRVKWERSFRGPTLIIPRVGRPDASKVIVQNFEHPVVLSDCLISVQSHSVSQLRQVAKKIKNNWDIVSREYAGTGAPYITKTKFSSLLRLLVS